MTAPGAEAEGGAFWLTATRGTDGHEIGIPRQRPVFNLEVALTPFFFGGVGGEFLDSVALYFVI